MQTNIGIFDSGIGGVTVLKECINICPNHNYIYISDSKNNPYGEKTKEEVIKYSENNIKKLIELGCKIIIIACNTASTISIEYLRNKYKDINLIAIEPAIKQAYINNKEKGCLIMATPNTLNSNKFKELYNKYHNDNFYILPCTGLAHLIENNKKEEIINYLENNLIKYKNNISSIVLGCTHYPLIKKEIKKIIPNITFYDGSIGVAKKLKEIINIKKYKKTKNNITFIDTNNNKDKEKRFYEIIGDNNE